MAHHDDLQPTDHEPITPSPIGEMPAFFLMRLQRQADRVAILETTEYKGIEDFEDIPEVFGQLSDYAQAFRAAYGAENRALDPASVKIYGPEGMSRIAGVLPEAENGGIFDPETGLVHIERKSPETTAERITFYYAMAHEIGHQLTSALCVPDHRLGFAVKEGVADRFAKGFMQSVLLPSQQPEVLETIDRYVATANGTLELDGIAIDASDILLAQEDADDVKALCFSRVLEMKALAAIEQTVGSSTYNTFMKMALSGDINALHLLGQQFDATFWSRVNALTGAANKLPADAIIHSLTT